MEIAVGWAQVLAALVAVVALIVTSVSRRADAERAEVAQANAERAAERAEATSALSIDQLSRIATSIQALELTVGIDSAPAHVAAVAWRLIHRAGDTYHLENIGGKSALDVIVTGHESLYRLSDIEGDVSSLGPGEAVTFFALRSMSTSDSTITVQWNEEGSPDRETWRYPLPPRPPRGRKRA
ncbi:hypothetical protein [Demequina aurantiaca]|uniref:hypothetical protein n=1 Tax=Demequina aurantiaca TaxID=676200 RepID=UPI003D351898